MTTKELETLRNVFHLYNNGIISEFQMGITVASQYARREITKDSFEKICDYFGATEELRKPEFVSHIDSSGKEVKLGIPKETWDFINIFGEA